MAIDWSTFLLELINFLILLWILKRFLYAPVKAAIERRQERVQQVLNEADARRAEAERMRSDYEARQQAWEHERAQARAALEQEINAERARRLEEVKSELERQVEKAKTLEERRRDELEHRSQETALALAANFGARLLSRLADQNLEARLVDLAIEDLGTLSPEHRRTLAAAAQAKAPGVQVLSAYPMSDGQRRALEDALGRAAGRPLRCRFLREPALIAGLRIDAGPLVMGANLRDELRYFANSSR